MNENDLPIRYGVLLVCFSSDWQQGSNTDHLIEDVINY